MATKKCPPGTKRKFIRNLLVGDPKITNKSILKAWKTAHPKVKLAEGVVKSERTKFQRLLEYDERHGLVQFFTSQTETMLSQYENIEQLLGPPDSDWTWIGEHCEVLLREAIRKFIPPSLGVAKGYIHGVRRDGRKIDRCPEIDILVFDPEIAAPLFSMGDFAIVRPESVIAIIQVKRTLSETTLAKAVDNIVEGKKHIRDCPQFGFRKRVGEVFSAVVTFEDTISDTTNGSISASYINAIQKHITSEKDGYVLPNFVGSLKRLFLLFTGVNNLEMGYQTFSSESDDGTNRCLAILLFFLCQKAKPSGNYLPPAFPKFMKVRDYARVWIKADD